MSDGKKPARQLIPVEIINRYSSVFNNDGDIKRLSKTGYKEALVSSGFMDELSVLLIRTLEAATAKQYQAQQHYEKYYEYKGHHEFPIEYAHPEWDSVRVRLSDEMTIEDVCLLAFPIVGGIFDNMREVLSRKIIERVLDEDKYPMLHAYPNGVVDEIDYKKKEYLHAKGVISLSEFRYACHAGDFKVVMPESKINKRIHDQRKTEYFLEIWENLLFEKRSRSNSEPTTRIPTTTDQEASAKNIHGKHFELLTQAISVFKNRYPDQWVTDTSVWANLPELCPALVLSIQGKGEASQAIMKHDKPWKWRAFKSAFQRHQKTHGDT